MKKKKKKSACAAPRDTISFNSWGWELPLDFFCYKDLSDDISDRRQFSKKDLPQQEFSREGYSKGYFGYFAWDILKMGFQDGVLKIPWNWVSVEVLQLETSERSTCIWKSHLSVASCHSDLCTVLRGFIFWKKEKLIPQLCYIIFITLLHNIVNIFKLFPFFFIAKVLGTLYKLIKS